MIVMARIEVDCTACGSVLLRGGDFLLRRWQDTPTYYIFSCTKCHVQVQRRADPETVEILLAEGARMFAGDVPAEMLEPRTGAPLTERDAAAFGKALDEPDWMTRLIASMHGVNPT